MSPIYDFWGMSGFEPEYCRSKLARYRLSHDADAQLCLFGISVSTLIRYMLIIPVVPKSEGTLFTEAILWAGTFRSPAFLNLKRVSEFNENDRRVPLSEAWTGLCLFVNMNLHVKASFVTVEGGPVNHYLGCLAELEIACILYRRPSSKDRWNPTHEYVCRWFRFAQLAKGKKSRP